MSVFRGSITEYPGVIVDHFIAANCEMGRVFFLSHCHRDHMTGLGSPNIVKALQKWETNLLCSEVTQSLLRNDPEFTLLAPYLRGLPMDEPIVMNLEASGPHERLNFTVTLLPAGHCPGSSMFFFQGDRGNVLYTGDFRLRLEETKRLRSLHCGGSLLKVSTLYVDTTFYHPIATEIPSRDTSRDIVLRLIEKWLAKDPSNVVHLQCASFGYEHIFMAVHKRFKTKIHIAPWKMTAYQEISAVTDCLTTDGDSTQIHSCISQRGEKGRPGLPCGSCKRNGASPNVLKIKPSTQWFLFRRKSIKDPVVFLPRLQMFRVIHSMHASFSELCDFIGYVRPRRIVPCVVPFGDSSLADVCARLKELMPQTEVGSGCVDLQEDQRILQRKHSHKRSTRNPTATATDSGEEGWSTGDDSIDEFTSTEPSVSSAEGDVSVFTHSQSHTSPISLPSLIAVQETKSTPPPSADSGATLGTLVQSPIDLSLSPSLESTTSVRGVCPPADSSTVSETEKVSELSESNSPRVEDVKTKCGSEERDFSCGSEERDFSCGSEERDFSCGSEERDFSCGSEERDFREESHGTPDQASRVEEEVGTPVPKRARLSPEQSSVSRKLFNRNTTYSDQEEVQEEVKVEEKEEGEEVGTTSPCDHLIIDLTQEDQDETLVAPEMIDLTQDHLTPPPEPNITNREEEEEEEEEEESLSSGVGIDHTQSVVHSSQLSLPVALSESQSSESTSRSTISSRRSASVESGGLEQYGSPNCLPPTPGRENVYSILQRPDFP